MIPSPIALQPLQAQLNLLPEPWDLIDTFRDTCVIASVPFHLVGYTARRRSDQVAVMGSACAWDHEPLDTAWFELLERISIVTARTRPEDTTFCLRPVHGELAPRVVLGRDIFTASTEPELWTPAKSNGVAMGATLKHAQQHALAELIERHLTLASWYGARIPAPVEHAWPKGLQALAAEYSLETYSMGTYQSADASWHATTTLLWPRQKHKPMIHGFGCASSTSDASARSLKEALQRLAFLYDAEYEGSVPTFRPSPDFHQDFYLQAAQQENIRRWLRGEHFVKRYQNAVPFAGEAIWVDLTPHESMPGKIVQVFVPGTLPLMFGRYRPPQFPDLPEDRCIHPIM